MWQYHYELILNCVDKSKYKNKFTTTLCNINFESGKHDSVAEVANASMNLTKGQSSGSDGLTGEAFLYSSQTSMLVMTVALGDL